MAIDLLSIQPHVVSRDLSGYITFIYGKAGIGKTTLAMQFPDPILLAFEVGYNTMPGIIAQKVESWAVMKQIYRELKKPEVQARFKTVVIDTADYAADCCQKYICNQLGIENIGDGGWSTNGWAKYKKEFEETWRSLTMMGYAVVFISHEKEKTIKPQNGAEYQQICPSVQSSACAILEGLSDIYAHCDNIVHDGTSERMLVLRSPDNSVACKSRFRYMENQIPLGYQSLVDAVNRAIDKEAGESNNQYVTNDRTNTNDEITYDFDALIAEFQDMVGILMNKDQTYYAPRITQIIDKYLGKGKKILDATRDQVEMINLIVLEIKEDLYTDALK